ncbi:von Willebrand factor A domain-containing protein 5A [Sciurus carolinensis]|uniref:von Willebrand factor A domain-containing protein 5A n=1 Tax=Sciurus carolinensis TaxID=30640 RepID=A0AA41MZU4_SCICA|nr:von Willebrand factor A domain-containing protein 5A [Sciurus carolinensis]
MDEDSAVYSFEALVDGKKIVAELQDKMKAERNCKDAVITRGIDAHNLQESQYSQNVFCFNVGNLEPGSKVEITLRYVQELSLESDGVLHYVLPAILNPRCHLSVTLWPGLFAKALTNVNIGSLICNVGAGGPAPSTAAAPAEEKKVEAKKDESEESDDDMGFGLFD